MRENRRPVAPEPPSAAIRVVALGGIEAILSGCRRKFSGAQAEDVTVFDEDADLVVVVLRHGELVVEAEFERSRFKFLDKIDARLGAVGTGTAVALVVTEDHDDVGRGGAVAAWVVTTAPPTSKVTSRMRNGHWQWKNRLME
jgi:hypothetical protein